MVWQVYRLRHLTLRRMTVSVLMVVLLIGTAFAESPEEIFVYAKGDYERHEYFNARMQLHRIASDIGEAAYLLATIYEKGLGTKKDMSKAIEYYKMAANNGYLKAIKHLALSNHSKANNRYWIQMLSNKNIPQFQYREGTMSENKEAGSDLILSSARQGYLPAQKEMAMRYLKGIGVYQNHKKAFYWFKKAAEQGDTESVIQVAGAYMTGFPVTKSTKKAILWYKKTACNKDDLESSYSIAYMLFRKKDYLGAYEWSLHAHKIINSTTEIKNKKKYLDKFKGLVKAIMLHISNHKMLEAEERAPLLCIS